MKMHTFLRIQAIVAFTRSPILWNITKPSGIPIKANSIQKSLPNVVDGVGWPYPENKNNKFICNINKYIFYKSAKRFYSE